MGSKKHKKESKKKKHRSRSRSPLDNGERERKRHKKHKDRKKDRSPDVEEVPVDSHLIADSPPPESPAPQQRTREQRDKSNDKVDSPPAGGGSGSLTVDETNRLRAKLGLKPLQVAEKPADDGKIKDDLGEFYHKPATNITQQKKTEKLKEKLEERKEKRKMEQKLKTTLLAEGSDDEDAQAWVKKSREMEKLKREAEKRAAMLDEMDEVFGVSALVADEQRREREHTYSEKHLHGLRVAHRPEQLQEERDVVLTLADRAVLEDEDDVLVNVNMVDDRRYMKNIEERKKAATGYQAYDEEASTSLLAKYDDEKPEEGFRIGEDITDLQSARQVEQQAISKKLESLWQPPPRLASDYLDHNEISFKKPKKKGKSRSRPKAGPIDVDEYDTALHTDDTEVKGEMGGEADGLVVDEEEPEPDGELQAALARARRLHQASQPRLPKVEEVLEKVKEEPLQEEEEGMVLDATAEFCRTLPAAPAYRPAPESEEVEEMEMGGDETAVGGAWSQVDTRTERRPHTLTEPESGLSAEPALGSGVAGALRLARCKGYLQSVPPAPPPPARTHSAHYCIEDKALGEDDKYNRRERGHSGPLQEFREKPQFRPSVKLEYVDDDGRPLCPKEAFRYLSHKFHGKGPGKNKQEKRIKKAVQEALMKKMSSTDTPLNTLQMLQDKQRETRSAHVLLSGPKREPQH